MIRAPDPRLGSYPGDFGFQHPERLRSRTDKRSIAADITSELSRRYQLRNVAAVFRELHRLADRWVTSRDVSVVPQGRVLEKDRERILAAR